MGIDPRLNSSMRSSPSKLSCCVTRKNRPARFFPLMIWSPYKSTWTPAWEARLARNGSGVPCCRTFCRWPDILSCLRSWYLTHYRATVLPTVDLCFYESSSLPGALLLHDCLGDFFFLGSQPISFKYLYVLNCHFRTTSWSLDRCFRRTQTQRLFPASQHTSHWAFPIMILTLLAKR